MPISRRKLPPLNALRAFDVAGRRLSFRAAADELGVTQGAVAQQVRALEAHLGVHLFQRLPRGVALTPAGASYLSDISHAFDTLTTATERLAHRPDRVTISVTPTIAAKLLIPRLAHLYTVLPQVELQTIATDALSDFDRDHVDIAIRLTPRALPTTLEAELLFHQELIAVASPHLVLPHQPPLSAAQLITLPLLHDAHDRWPAFLNSPSRLPGTLFNQTALAIDAALGGQGVALTNKAFVADDLRSGRLIAVSEHCITLPASYYLLRKRSATRLPAVDAVWDWCLQQFQH
ncbi:MAG: LysR substrate-binding domain-containing protein [Paenalcaligenes sp.]